MFRRSRKDSPPPSWDGLTAPTTRVQLPAPEPVTLTAWHDLAEHLIAEGAESLECPPICRRKGVHRHLRHTGASADVIVFPAAVERAGA